MIENAVDRTELAARVLALSRAQWGGRRDTDLIGVSTAVTEAQHRLLRCAQADGPVLITGETGTGKELFARACYLLSRRLKQPYLCVNCAQYQDSQLLASELFGHRRGAFTGAVADHRGVFEEAGDGIVFLDEIAELSLGAQAMLLRALSESEIMRVGESVPRPISVRIIAATRANLVNMVAEGRFREDLYYRIRFFQVHVPPLRDRGEDVGLIADHIVHRLSAATKQRRVLSAGARQLLCAQRWPGNVRELLGVVETIFHSATEPLIREDCCAAELSANARDPVVANAAQRREPLDELMTTGELSTVHGGAATPPEELYRAMVVDTRSFWEVVYAPFMARDLSRREAREVIEFGLRETRGSYKRLLEIFRIERTDYLRFMDFLRHHRLKPSRHGDSRATRL